MILGFHEGEDVTIPVASCKIPPENFLSKIKEQLCAFVPLTLHVNGSGLEVDSDAWTVGTILNSELFFDRRMNDQRFTFDFLIHCFRPLFCR